MKKVSVRRSSCTRGSIIVLSVFTALGFAAIFSVSYHFWVAPLIQNDLFARADALALACAARLNQNDQAGRMNNLLVRARELAIESDDAHEAMEADDSPLVGLSEQLRDEANEGLGYAVAQSQALTRATIDDVRSFVGGTKAFPGLARTVLGTNGDTVVIESCQLGDQEKTDSNVLAEHTFPYLRTSDKDQGLIRDDVGVYRSDMPLPGRQRQPAPLDW